MVVRPTDRSFVVYQRWGKMGSSLVATDRGEAGALPPAAKLKVLVVDDDHAVAKQLADGLELLGYTTEVAHNAAEATAAVEATPEIGIVVTDIRMPGGSGLSLADSLLAHERGPSTLRVILMTGHATLEDASAAVRKGVSDFLVKPFRLKDIAASIEKAYAQAAAARREAALVASTSARLDALEEERIRLLVRLERAEKELRGQAPGIGSSADDIGANLPKTELAAVSHALRTPLNAISGGTQILSQDVTKADVGLEILSHGVQRATESIELIEEFLRVTTGSPAEQAKPVDLLAALHAAVAEMAERAPTRQIGVSIDETQQKDLWVVAPPQRAHRIVLHCLGAALAWAGVGRSVTATPTLFVDAERRWMTVTFVAGTATPPAGPILPNRADVFARTQEDLRFMIARRLAVGIGGHVSSWNVGGEGMAIRLALPA